MRVNEVAFTLTLLGFLAGCTAGDTCERSSELKRYLTNELQYSPGQGSQVLVILPTETCQACLDKTLALLQSGDGKYDVIIGGSPGTVAEEYDSFMASVKGEVPFDSLGCFELYEIGAQVPVAIHYVDGRCRYFVEMTENNHPVVREYFSWK
jgi:hypothetical protein